LVSAPRKPREFARKRTIVGIEEGDGSPNPKGREEDVHKKGKKRKTKLNGRKKRNEKEKKSIHERKRVGEKSWGAVTGGIHQQNPENCVWRGGGKNKITSIDLQSENWGGKIVQKDRISK